VAGSRGQGRGGERGGVLAISGVAAGSASAATPAAAWRIVKNAGHGAAAGFYFNGSSWTRSSGRGLIGGSGLAADNNLNGPSVTAI
jgi:hypothetical protein